MLSIGIESEKLQKILIKYCTAIYNFEEIYIKQIYDTPINKINTLEGYLINLIDYKDLKRKIDYNTNIKKISSNSEEKIKIFDHEKIFRIKGLEIKTSTDLINMLNKNNYILVNTDLWETIGDKNQIDNIPINYQIDNNDIIILFSDNKIIFSGKNKNNILEKSNLINYTLSNLDQIKTIYKDIEIYYQFEKEFLNDIKEKKKSNQNLKYGYLIDKNWFEKWKLYSNYEHIKTYFFEKNEKVENNIINILKKHLEEKNINYAELIPIKTQSFNNMDELESYLKNDSLILINKFIKFSFLENIMFKCFKYDICENQINIYLNEILRIKTSNNIISLNKKIINNNSNNPNTNYNFEHLKQLIKIFYFQEDFNKKINSPGASLLQFSPILLINKKVINKYKNYFNYNRLYNFLKDFEKTKNIKYEDLETYFEDIINNMDIKDKEYLNEVKKKSNLSGFNFEKINSNFEIRNFCINCPNLKNLKYITDFEFINDDINQFFIEKNLIKNNNVIPTHYIFENGKILISLKLSDFNTFYEIGFINNNNFIIEYLLEECTSNNKNSIISFFSNNGLKPFEEKKYKEGIQNTITIDGQINPLLFWYKIKNKEELFNGESRDNLEANKKGEEFNFKKNIFLILILIYKFEEELKHKIKISKMQNNHLNSNTSLLIEECYLIDEELLSNFKKLFPYDNIGQFSDILINDFNDNDIEKIILNNNNNKKFFELFLNKKDEFNKIFNKDVLNNINKKTQSDNNRIYIYPNNFEILPKSAYSKILQVLNLDIDTMEQLKFNLGFNNERIVLKPKLKSFFEEYKETNYLSYIYFIKNNDDINKIFYYIPENILSYSSKEERNNHFNFIIKGYNIFQSRFLSTNLNFKIIKIINDFCNNIVNNEQLLPSKNKNNYNNNDTKLNKLLSYAIIIYNEYLKIQKIKHNNSHSIFTPFLPQSTKQKEETEFFLINKEYMDKIKIILNFNEIEKILKSNTQINTNLKITDDFNNSEIIKLKKLLLEKTYNFLNSIDQSKIDNDYLNDQKLYEIPRKDYFSKYGQKLSYYNNCQIINKEIINIIKEIDLKFKQKIKIMNCFYIENKIIAKIDNYLIF